MNFYNIIYNLETICNIQNEDKLIIRDNLLIICPKNIFRPLYRYSSNQNREQLNLFLIKLFLDLNLEIDKYKNYCISNSIASKIQVNIKSKKRFDIIKNLISRSKVGIDKLKLTYKRDKYFVRKLDLIIEKFNLV